MSQCYTLCLITCHIVTLHVLLYATKNFLMLHCHVPLLHPIVLFGCLEFFDFVHVENGISRWCVSCFGFREVVIVGGRELLVKMLTICYHFIFFVVENDNVFCYSGTFWQSLFYRARDVKEIYSDLQEFQTRSSDLTQWLVVQIEMLENAENDSLNAQQLNDKVTKCNVQMWLRSLFYLEYHASCGLEILAANHYENGCSAG